jgi:hypothetical protein
VFRNLHPAPEHAGGQRSVSLGGSHRFLRRPQPAQDEGARACARRAGDVGSMGCLVTADHLAGPDGTAAAVPRRSGFESGVRSLARFSRESKGWPPEIPDAAR